MVLTETTTAASYRPSPHCININKSSSTVRGMCRAKQLMLKERQTCAISVTVLELEHPWASGANLPVKFKIHPNVCTTWPLQGANHSRTRKSARRWAEKQWPGDSLQLLQQLQASFSFSFGAVCPFPLHTFLKSSCPSPSARRPK